MIILITGASSGFGALAARALATAGHIVFAGIRDTGGRNSGKVDDAKAFAALNNAQLNAVELDVTSDESTRLAVEGVFASHGRIDCIIHNAGHMVFGPSEAFAPEQLAALYDVNVLGTQRLNRAVLPQMRARGDGLVIWVGSSSTRGGTPPYLGPYFAAKAAMDALAVSYSGELARWGIETSIIVPGAFTKGTNHFENAGQPDDHSVAGEYITGPYQGIEATINDGLASLEHSDADASFVADAIVRVVGTPHGSRPFRVHIDPSQDGCEVVAAVADRIRAEFLRRIGLTDILAPSSAAPRSIERARS